MKSNKGFTLIELLAVIVILAIIALIATPVILNIINDARDSAKARSGELIKRSVELAYQTKYASTGSAPTLSEVIDQLSKDQIENATVDTTNKKVTTKDGIECTLAEDTSSSTRTLTMSCTRISSDNDVMSKINITAGKYSLSEEKTQVNPAPNNGD